MRDATHGSLKVTVGSAKGLPATNRDGTCDAHIQVTAGRRRQKTRTIGGIRATAVWDQALTLDGISMDDSLTVRPGSRRPPQDACVCR